MTLAERYLRRPAEPGRDERDQRVDVRGKAAGFLVFSVLAAVPLVLGLLGPDPFWTTNALLLAFAVTAVSGVAATVVLYRRGGW